MQARKREAKAETTGKRLLEGGQKALDQIVLGASVGLLLSLAYLLFVILSGGLAAPIIAGSALEQVTRNIGLAKSVFLWCLWIVVIAAMIRHYRTEGVGLAVVAVGVGCWAFMPLIVRSRIESTSANALLQLGQSLISSFQTSGGALVVLGVLRVATGRLVVLASPARAAAKFSVHSGAAGTLAAERADQKPSLLRRCWELHFCRSSLRSNCPRFLEAVSCWKRRSGCYCDQGLATRLLTGIGAESRARVAEELEVAHRRHRTTQGRRQKRRQKAPCGECPVYLEHQKHKYRVVSWFAYPAAAALIGGTVAVIREGYRWVEDSLGGYLANFQLLPEGVSARQFDQAVWLSAENGAVLLIGVLLVGLVLHAMEIAIFRLKL